MAFSVLHKRVGGLSFAPFFAEVRLLNLLRGNCFSCGNQGFHLEIAQTPSASVPLRDASSALS